jgi:hypothetical protein
MVVFKDLGLCCVALLNSDFKKCVELIILLQFILAIKVHAQFYETIRSGRPGQSIGAFTVGKNIFQIQSGIDHFGYNEDETQTKGNGLLINTGLRYGLTEMFEVGAYLEYKSESIKENTLKYAPQGFSNVVLGLRHQIFIGKGLIPSVGFQLRVKLPSPDPFYKTDYIAPSFVFVTSQQLSSSWTLITNLGSSWNGNTAAPAGLYTVNISCAITSKFGAFIENYGNFTDSSFDTRFDTGIAWLVTPNLQLDLLGGFGSNHGLKDYFISTGFSWRTHKHKSADARLHSLLKKQTRL